MNSSEAITKIKLLLGLNEETVETTLEFASKELVDGTKVAVEGEFEEGKQAFVETEEGKITMPEGVHQTMDDMLITVDSNGTITSVTEIEEKEVEAEETEEVAVEMETEEKEEKMEYPDKSKEEMEEEEAKKVEMEEKVSMAEEVIEAMKPYFDHVETLKSKIEEMEAKFENFSAQPAAKKIKKNNSNFAEERFSAVDRIVKMRKK